MNTRHTPPAPERLCRFCGDPLPPQKGRSRPRVAHEGDCSRKYHNKRRLNWRIDRFRTAHRADRSDALAWAPSQYNYDDYDPEGFSTSRGAFDDVHGDALIEAMNLWESAETARRLMARTLAEVDYDEWYAENAATLTEEQLEAVRKVRAMVAPDPAIVERERRTKEALAALTDEEKADRLRLGVARWKARSAR